jgi:hypothetical protein
LANGRRSATGKNGHKTRFIPTEKNLFPLTKKTESIFFAGVSATALTTKFLNILNAGKH